MRVSHVANFRGSDFVGINWGSSNFRAYRISEEGHLVDQFSAAAGVSGIDRDGMVAQIDEMAARWPDLSVVYASGMIGSNIGWREVPYVQAPAKVSDICKGALLTTLGKTEIYIVPGVCCRREFDDGPDIMRGEEIELFGLAAQRPQWSGLVALPGTHTKWAQFSKGRITDFFTSMSGEIFDRLTAAGLLASIVMGSATDGSAFQEGVEIGHARNLGLGTLLFGARARVMQARLERKDAASYLRGLLIGSEIADALAIHPDLSLATVPLIGNGPLCQLYAKALQLVGVQSEYVDSGEVCIRGFLALKVSM